MLNEKAVFQAKDAQGRFGEIKKNTVLAMNDLGERDNISQALAEHFRR